MIEQSIPPRPDLADAHPLTADTGTDIIHTDKMDENGHSVLLAAKERVATSAVDLGRKVTDATSGLTPHVAAAADRTRDAAEKTVVTSGKAARVAGQQARRHPRATSGVVAGGVVLLLMRRAARLRHRAAD